MSMKQFKKYLSDDGDYSPKCVIKRVLLGSKDYKARSLTGKRNVFFLCDKTSVKYFGFLSFGTFIIRLSCTSLSYTSVVGS